MLGMALSRAANATVEAYGTPTLVNGETVPAIWSRAQPGRVQMFLNDTTWAQPGWEVKLAPSALEAPVSLSLGDTLTWLATGWQAVVRGLEVDDLQGVPGLVTAIAEQTSE